MPRITPASLRPGLGGDGGRGFARAAARAGERVFSGFGTGAVGLVAAFLSADFAIAALFRIRAPLSHRVARAESTAGTETLRPRQQRRCPVLVEAILASIMH